MKWIKNLTKELKGGAKVSTSPAVLKKYSRDASIFEVTPQAVVYPKTEQDLETLVNFVRTNKHDLPFLSLTARGAGTDMSGGAINDSIIIDFSKYFNHIGEVHGDHITTQPGAYYRKFERKTMAHDLLLPPYPSSRELCCVGGMVANNCGGEKTLNYGKTINYVNKLKVVLADGKTYNLEPLNKEQLDSKMKQRNFEGTVYKKLHRLLEDNYNAIKAAKPKVTKNSTGYNLWDVWDRETFDLTKLFTGSQGTLGLISEIDFHLVPVKEYSSMLVIYMKALTPELVNTVLPTKPNSFEVFDDHSLLLAIKYFFGFRKVLGWWRTIVMAFEFLPDIWNLRHGIPKMVALVEFEGSTQEEADMKVEELERHIHAAELPVLTEQVHTANKARRFWMIRRESFNLLRQRVKDRVAAPFIDDLTVPTDTLTEYIPAIEKILTTNHVIDTIAGHAGNGNFHIIPLLNLGDPRERAMVPDLLNQTTALVKKYGGVLAGEHNDGLVRGHLLEEIYGPEMAKLFKETKKIFDPTGIFNPHKKIDAVWDYSAAHMRRN